MSDANDKLNQAIGRETGEGRFQVAISSGGVQFFADEPKSAGGLGSGPNPYQLLGSALAACTTMTLRLYADQKGWPVEDIRTAVGHRREQGGKPADLFIRHITFSGDLTEEQRARLLEIADRCPVHRTLTASARVETKADELAPACDGEDAHMADMEALISVGRRSFDFTD